MTSPITADEEMRQAFEAWNGVGFTRCGEAYSSHFIQGQWAAWQAAWNLKTKEG